MCFRKYYRREKRDRRSKDEERKQLLKEKHLKKKKMKLSSQRHYDVLLSAKNQSDSTSLRIDLKKVFLSENDGMILCLTLFERQMTQFKCSTNMRVTYLIVVLPYEI